MKRLIQIWQFTSIIPDLQGAETKENSRLASAIYQVTGQPGLHDEI